MVQGWESRAELANKRREQARERKHNRKASKRVTGDMVLNFLMCHKYVSVEDRAVQAWIGNEDGGKPLCTAHFRAEACHVKRCKHSHIETVSLMQGVEYSEGMEFDETEVYMDRFDNIYEIPPAHYPKLRLLFVDGVCVFDHANPSQWQAWSGRVKEEARRREEIEESMKLSTLSTIREFIEPDSEQSDIAMDVTSITAALCEASIHGSTSSSSNTPLTILLPSGMMNFIFSFASDVELCRLYMSSSAIKEVITSDSTLCSRHRAYLRDMEPTGKDLSKLKKQEKKKKLKAANSKVTNKKDGHKKVKVCRR